ncbi:non-secretory ribonuclease-like [Desmodus rotundus]|uniref:non-secretory ribonuclease-like n=1 Tax=Desmodus rotundus TaxID=9430 RepID=UPI000D17EE24|nr:non-secretory ribonuclease-like [Desmodus rotundus]XP_045057844.1 non-secretory ribonuclease-like [Desmodus rotundus]XP_045057845.1 non-secretory ribonuclease-like [Desmodus rotundus]XP_045057846.1 non-secretory ribonuclease-like [Desmodus rotundus]XP_045057848.1 non-secretory ribonuclease-like [Desmodus rotundus]
MVPTQQNSQLCLLLLGLLGMMILVHAPPPGITPAQWFVIQHINMTNNLCNIAMRAINHYNLPPRICKKENTFLNTTTLAAVTNLCHTPNITCFRRGHNCHRSPAAVNVTYCNVTRQAQTYLQCQYQQYFVLKNYSIACDNTNVLVHFDRLY